MRTQPDLDESQLVQAVRQSYGLDGVTVKFMPVGEDGWGYRVTAADGHRYYLKVYRRARDWAKPLAALAALCDRHGFRHAAAPLATVSGAWHLSVAGRTVALFDYMDGAVLDEKAADAEAWREVGRMLARLHAMSKDAVDCGQEQFGTADKAAGFRQVMEALDGAAHSDNPFRRELADLYRARRARFWQEWEQFEAAAAQARQAGAPFVLCHGEPNPRNIILSGGTLCLVDWDDMALAPKERDLVFHADRRAVLDGYAQVAGPVTLDAPILAFYHRQWNVGEIIDWGQRLLFKEQDAAQSAHDLQETKEFLAYSGLA